ncbi:MAG: hypothetical protein IPQ04_14400 [Saprospiraceae bacterium]|nr:hypothetical protein [Saprospiraceae bacterium]
MFTFCTQFSANNMTLEASQIKEYLAQPRVIGLFSHRNPDGDALGSTLAMQHLLVQMGHTAEVMVPSRVPAEL